MLRSGGLEADGDAAKQCVVRACCSKGDADACGGLGDACGDLEEARAQGGELGVGERMRLVDGVAHRQHQPVGGGMQHETHLIGECRATTGPIGGKLALVQLDQVLGLAARAVERVLEPLRAAAVQVGHHVADVQSLGAGFDACHHAPLAAPGFGAIAGLGIAA